MALTTGQEREIARLKEHIMVVDLQAAGSGGNDVEHHEIPQRRHFYCPRRGEFRVAIKVAAHLQKVEDLA